MQSIKSCSKVCITPRISRSRPQAHIIRKQYPLRSVMCKRPKLFLKQAGVTTPLKAELMVGNSKHQSAGRPDGASPWPLRPGLISNSEATEYATLIKEQAAGNFQLSLAKRGPAGSIPMAISINFVTCKGNLNDMKYCNKEVDGFLNDAREAGEQSARIGLYDFSPENTVFGSSGHLPLFRAPHFCDDEKSFKASSRIRMA